MLRGDLPDVAVAGESYEGGVGAVAWAVGVREGGLGVVGGEGVGGGFGVGWGGVFIPNYCVPVC